MSKELQTAESIAMGLVIIPLTYPLSKAGARLGVGRTKIYELVNAGALRTIDLGGKRVIADSELQRFIAEKIVEGAQ